MSCSLKQETLTASLREVVRATDSAGEVAAVEWSSDGRASDRIDSAIAGGRPDVAEDAGIR